MIIEEKIIQHLNSESMPAYAERPTNPPSRYILVEVLGKAETDRMTTARVSVKVYAETRYMVLTLAEDVLDSMLAMSGVYGVHLSGGNDYTNSLAKEYAEELIFEITYNRKANNG